MSIKTRKKSSPIWLLPENEFIELIRTSKRIKDVLAFFGLLCKGGNFRTVTSRIQNLGLDTSHFLTRTASSTYTRSPTKENTQDKFIENSETARKDIKRYIIKLNLIPYECEECKNNGNWNQKPLSLQLEHKNGVSNDNRLENLCFLCPNCHSQTETYAGKKLRKVTKL